MAGPASLSPDISPIQIPPLVHDPTWSLQPWPVEISMGRLLFSIPALPAATWLTVLMNDPIDLEDILPGLADPSQADALEEALVLGEVGLDIVYKMALKVLDTVCGRPWYVAMRIIATAAGAWTSVGGEFVIRNVDASRISVAAWLDAAYLLLLRSMDRENIDIFNAKLLVPPPGYRDLEDTSEKMLPTAESFMAMDLG